MQPFPTTMMVQIKFRYDWPTGCGILKFENVYTQPDRHTDDGSTGIL